MKNKQRQSGKWKSVAGQMLAALWILAIPLTSVAQGLNTNAGGGSQLFCKRDFSNFIVNGIDFDGEGFIDYWRDILVIYNTNYCQFADIDSLLDRIDKARKQIRQAFYVCDNTTASKATAQYYQLSAELYYLRHFVDTAETPNPKASEEEKSQKVVPRDIKNQFLNLFVTKKNYFSQSQGEAEFERIKQKYESKIEAYKNCVDPNLEQLKQRIESLANTIDTIKQMGQRFADRTKNRISAMEKRIKENPGLITAFSSDSLGDFFNRTVDARINAEPVQNATIWEQISFQAKQSAQTVSVPSAPLPAVTMQYIANDIENIEKRETQINLDLIYLTEYDLKYRQVEGLGLDTLKVNLDTLMNTIKSTFDPLNKIYVCTANIVGKQCGG